jgi:hypothetical protein
MDASGCYDCIRRCLYLCETYPAYAVHRSCEAFCNAKCAKECRQAGRPLW